MPIYEYSCDKCGNVIERIQKFSDPLLTDHEDCGGALTKLISQSSFQLKGDGWYVADYARKDKKEGADGDKKDAAQTDSKDSKDVKEAGSSDKTDKAKTASETTKKESSTPNSDKSKPPGGSG